MRVICTSGSVGAPGEPSPGATRPDSRTSNPLAPIESEKVMGTVQPRGTIFSGRGRLKLLRYSFSMN
jgi:hypothetical protein